MSRTYRRMSRIPSWITEDYPLWQYRRDRGRNWHNIGSLNLKKEARRKRRAHARQELARFAKNPDYPVGFHKKYGNPWNWD